MSEKRFAAHDTSVSKVLKTKTQKKRQREINIVGRIFEKRKERRARSSHYGARRVKQVSIACGVY